MANASPFSLNGQPNPNALLEHAVLISALYSNRQDLIDQVYTILGGATQLAKSWGNTSLPVSYLIWRQNSDIFIDICGTQNLAQMAGNVVGAYAIPFSSESGSIHVFFLAQAQIVLNALAAAVPSNRGSYTYHIAGHSLGGAVGWIVSQYIARTYGSGKVEHIGFASPKPTTAEFSGPVPNVNYLIANIGDPVPYLPPFNLINDVPVVGGVLSSVVGINWHHNYTCFQLDSSSNLASTPATTFDSILTPVGYIGGSLAHGIATYQIRVEQLWQAQVGTGQDAGLIPLSQVLRGLPPQQTATTTISATQSINITTANETIFNGNQSGPLTSANIQLVSSQSGAVNSISLRYRANMSNTGGNMAQPTANLWKCSMYIGDGTYGSSESVYANYQSPQTAQQVMNSFQALANQRSALLGSSFVSTGQVKGWGIPAINYLRVSQVANPKNSLLIPTALFGYNNSQNSAALFPGVMASTQIVGVNPVAGPTPNVQQSAASNLLITFLPSNVVSGEVFNGNVNMVPSGSGFLTWLQILQSYIAILTNAAGPWGFLGLSHSESKKPCSGVTVSSSGIATISCPNHGYNLGDQVRITRAKPSAWNGTYVITPVPPVAPQTQSQSFTLNKYINPNTAQPFLQANVQRVKLSSIGANGAAQSTLDKDFYAFSYWTNNTARLSAKRIGREFKVASFRRRKSRF